MKVVQPIRDLEKIDQMKIELMKIDYKYYILFIVGINVGLRISDILNLKVIDVKNKTHVIIKEQKTGKVKRFLLNDQMRQEINKYINGMADNMCLISSQKGENMPLQRGQAYKMLNRAARACGLSEIGTHSLRKTFGFWHYQTFKDVAILQQLFNHKSASVTLSYIGITNDMMDQTMQNFFLGEVRDL